MRKAQSNERTRTIQRLEKVLQDAGIKLTSVASQTYSKSARAMLEALLGGVTDPEQLAELAKARMRSKIPCRAPRWMTTLASFGVRMWQVAKSPALGRA